MLPFLIPLAVMAVKGIMVWVEENPETAKQVAKVAGQTAKFVGEEAARQVVGEIASDAFRRQ